MIIINRRILMHINRKATLQRTRDFFDNDYLKYLNNSNFTKYGLKSIDYTQPYVNHTRRTDGLSLLIAQAIDADAIITSVKQAIYDCPNLPQHPYRTILTQRYLKRYNAWQVALNIQYSASYYNKLQNEALLIFADRFTIQQVINQVKNIIDLHIYEN